MQNLDMTTRVQRFRGDETGSATVLGLFFFIATAVILGLALDQANGWRVRTQMQIATDAAALAGAANLDDLANARTIALEVANRNLPTLYAIEADDIHFGHVDLVSFEFVEGADNDGTISAVAVDAMRTKQRANAVPTYLLKLVGFDTLDVKATSVAAAQLNMNGGGVAGCEDAVFFSEASVSAGGGYSLEGAVCMHGNGTGTSGYYVHSGGDEILNPEVRFSSPNIDKIYLGTSYEPADLDRKQLMVERSMQASLLPKLDSMYDDLWAALWSSGDETYEGELLPSFFFENGALPIVRVDGYWNAMTTDFGWNKPVIQENHIYVVNGGVNIASGSSFSNVVIISNDAINVGGGGGTTFDKVYFFGRRDTGGSQAAVWGNPDVCASQNYTVYLFSKEGSVNFGNQASGVVAAGPRMNIGGSLNGSGIYIESRGSFPLGGDMDIKACGSARQPAYELTDFGVASSGSTGSYLYR